jgi:predicted nucleotidyltransferase
MMLDEMVEALSSKGIRFVVLGGVAAIAHGSAYNTNDLDVCYDTADDNVAKLIDVLKPWEPYPRGWDPSLPWYFDARTFKTTPLLTLRTREGDLDLLDNVAGVGDYHACLAASDVVRLGERQIRVLNLESLIKAKKAAGRKKDRERLIELEALQALREKS